MKTHVLVIVSMALAPGWAFAQNGVVLINQSTVAATASGANRSTGGFPYTITQPGSYQLSSNLTVPSVTGIVISASFVSLDLNGFNISCVGVGACTGVGILAETPQSGIAIRNGTVSGFGIGIFIPGATGSFIERVTAAQSNGGNGISVGDGSTVKDCFASNNHDDGINAGLHSIVFGSVASGNGQRGIQVGSGTLTGNTADSNLADGISVTGQGTLTGNTATNNGFGINLGDRSTATGNTTSGNQVGFSVACPVNLIGNTAQGNNGADFTSSGSGCNKVNNLGF